MERAPGNSAEAPPPNVRSKTSRATSGRRLGCVTPPVGWAGTPDISDKSDKSRRGELLAGKERAFVSRLGSQPCREEGGGWERRVKGSSPGTPPVEPLISPQNKLC